MRENARAGCPAGIRFCPEKAPQGPFCGAFSRRQEKKFDFYFGRAQRVAKNNREKVKNIFGGLEKGRIFAPAFDGGDTPWKESREHRNFGIGR